MSRFAWPSARTQYNVQVFRQTSLGKQHSRDLKRRHDKCRLEDKLLRPPGQAALKLEESERKFRCQVEALLEATVPLQARGRGGSGSFWIRDSTNEVEENDLRRGLARDTEGLVYLEALRDEIYLLDRSADRH
ncbi:MAG: hypothetical protein Q9201_000371 [Fulgogasparrea decipioides]